MFIDSHCHLDRLDLSLYDDNLDLAIAAARERGVDKMLCIGIDMSNSPIVVAIAERYEGIYASVGVHPMDVNDQLVSVADLRQLAASPKVVAIGETGLDYHYSTDAAELQRDSFAVHLQLAGELKKPVIVHTRKAQDDTLNLIRRHGDPDAGGVLHCFTESWDMARQALDMNYHISFSGIVTFKNASELREVVKQVPLERLLIETDSPYLAPVPFRGKSNEPKYVVEVAHCVAELKGISVEQLAEITSNNFNKLMF